MEWLTATLVAKVVLGLIIFALLFVLARRIAGSLGSQLPAFAWGRSKSVKTQTSPTQAPPPVAPKAAKGGGAGFGVLVKLLIVIIVAAAAVVALFWAFQHIVKPVIHSPVPVVSLRMQQQRAGSVRSMPVAGSLPVCAPNSAQTYEINEEDWSPVIEVPVGCTPVWNPGYASGAYLIEYRDNVTNEWTPVGDNYSAVRARKQINGQEVKMTVQVWFIPTPG